MLSIVFGLLFGSSTRIGMSSLNGFVGESGVLSTRSGDVGGVVGGVMSSNVPSLTPVVT